MGMVSRLRLLIDGDGELYECRNCGTNVTADTNRCPACEGEDIVRYSID